MGENRGLLWGVGAAVALLLLVGAWKFMPSRAPQQTAAVQSGGSPTQAPTPGAIEISIASSNTKELWLRNAATAFNDTSRRDKNLQVEGRPVFVQILQELVDGKEPGTKVKKDYRSGAMVKEILEEKIKPTIASPGEEVWVTRLKKNWQERNNTTLIRSDAPVLVRTPLVVAMWQSYAQTMGCWPTPGPNCTWQKIRELATNPEGWKMFGHPEWGKFTLGYGYYDKSNSGTLGIITMCMVGAKKIKGFAFNDASVDGGCGKFIKGIEMAKVHSGVSDVTLLEKMVQRGPEYLHAVITYESNVILFNRKEGDKLRQPLVSVYPQDGTVVVGHPYAVLDGAPWVTPEQVQAAKVFKDYLLSREQQEAVLNLGLRPADPAAKLGPPIEQSYGANPQAKLTTVELPDLLIWERIGEVWHANKKRAIVVIAIDQSGSMQYNNKMGAAVNGTLAFEEAMEPNDFLVYMPFDHNVYTTARGTKRQIGEKLRQHIQSTTANLQGGTALYDAIFAALQELDGLRKQHGDTVRYGIVLLSDGDDRNSKNASLSTIKARLEPQENDPHGFQIYPICIGSDCRKDVMKKIAEIANGQYSEGNTPKEMVSIYTGIATHY